MRPPGTSAGMQVAVIGTGYVGLVTGACLAAIGHRVVCIDSDASRAQAVARGQTPIFEASLPEMVREEVANGRLSATTDLEAGIRDASVILIAVGTPSTHSGIDLSAVENAARQIGRALRGRTDFPVVTVKSTVIPGTTDSVVRHALEEESGGRAGQLFGLAMNPEFLSQGSAVHDFLAADRIVIGQWDQRSGDALAALYRAFPAPQLRMSLREAEMVKYAANFLQALLIGHGNQIAALCEAIPGCDHRKIMEAVHLDRMLDGPDGGRAGAARFLMGGIGFGGSCFPKDLSALATFAHRLGVPAPMVAAVSAMNALRPGQIMSLLSSALHGIEDKRVAVFGLAFKPGTDDLRESPALKLITRLQSRGAQVRAHDPLPQARSNARALGLNVVDDVHQAVDQADAIILATAWPEYHALDWPALAATMRNPVVLDGRGVLDGLGLPAGLLVLRAGCCPIPPHITPEE